MEHSLWQTKLAAWIHDPAEKALVLLRDPAGHEGGTVRKSRRQLFPSMALPAAIQTAHSCKRIAGPPPPTARNFRRIRTAGAIKTWTQVNFARTAGTDSPAIRRRIMI